MSWLRSKGLSIKDVSTKSQKIDFLIRTGSTPSCPCEHTINFKKSEIFRTKKCGRPHHENPFPLVRKISALDIASWTTDVIFWTAPNECESSSRSFAFNNSLRSFAFDNSLRIRKFFSALTLFRKRIRLRVVRISCEICFKIKKIMSLKVVSQFIIVSLCVELTTQFLKVNADVFLNNSYVTYCIYF